MFTHQVTSKYSNYNLDVISISNIIKALSKHIIDFIYDLYHITICIICKYLEIKLSKPMRIYLHEMSWSNMSREFVFVKKINPLNPLNGSESSSESCYRRKNGPTCSHGIPSSCAQQTFSTKTAWKNGGNTYVKYINLLLPCSHWLTLLSFLADHLTSSGIWLSFSCLPQLQLALLPEYLQRC